MSRPGGAGVYINWCIIAKGNTKLWRSQLNIVTTGSQVNIISDIPNIFVCLHVNVTEI